MHEPGTATPHANLDLDATLAEHAAAAGQMHDAVLVESGLHRSRHATVAHLVFFRAGGLDAATLAEVTHDLQFRLGTTPGLDAAALDVSTPGIQRTLKHAREYMIFVGKGVRVLRTDSEAWHEGIISGVREDSLVLEPLAGATNGPRLVPFAQIRKAQLTGSEMEETRGVDDVE